MTLALILLAIVLGSLVRRRRKRRQQRALLIGADAIRKRGWAFVVWRGTGSFEIRIAASLTDILETTPGFDIVAIDIPIGLLDAYEIGGRLCDRQARALLGKRGSSVFPVPVRGTLKADSHDEACRISQASSPQGKKLSTQAFNIIPKIKEVDDLLRARPALRDVVREVHPELCFRELAGAPMRFYTKEPAGQEERQRHLRRHFRDLDLAAIEKSGRKQKIPIDDILDATVASWSALRLATGRGRSLSEPIPVDSKGLPMTMWV